MNTAVYDDVICGGDLNWHKGRNTGFASTVERFCDNAGLISCWDQNECDFTHIHVDLKSVTTLDHFLVNRRLLEFIECTPIHLGDNASRHSPIMLKLKVANIPRSAPVNMDKPRRPAWHKAGEEDINNYTQLLHDKLGRLDTPACLNCQDVHCQHENHSEVRDGHMLDILTAIIESSHSAIPMSGKPPVVNPDKNCPVNKAIPGWEENIKPQRDSSLFWHAVWISAARPNNGVLHDIMKKTRNQYHYAVRKVKKLAEEIRARELLTASLGGDVNLLKEMKKIRGNNKGNENLPDNVEGAEGQEEVVEKFREVYETLYNSAESSASVQLIKERLANTIGPESLLEVNKVTGEMVKKAATRIKPGKSDVSGAYTSDVLLHAPDSLFDKLAIIFRSFLTHGTVTRQLLACSFLPLLKSGLKDPAVTKSYRAIAGSSQILKLFDNVVLLVWGDYLSSDSLQFGYKEKTSTTQCSWLVMEVAQYYLRNGTKILVTLCDCSMAFDKCKFDILFNKLLDKGVPAIVVRVLIFVYEEQVAWVTWGNVKSQQFGILNGVRQGGILSPILWNVYCDGLLVLLRDLGVGCHLAGTYVGAAMFADDLALLAPTRSAMVAMLAVCEKYATDHNIVYSTDPNPKLSKTKVLYMCGSMTCRNYPAPVQLNGRDLPYVTTAAHLGNELTQACTMEQDCKIKRAEYIDKTVNIRETFSFAEPSQILQAIEKYCGDHYGAMLWPLDGEMTGQYFRCWSTCVKLVWDVPRGCHTYLVDNLLAANFVSTRRQILGRYVKFFKGLLSSRSKEVVLVANIVARDKASVTGRNLEMLREETGLNPWSATPAQIRESLPKAEVPQQDRYRLGLLEKYLSTRKLLESDMGDTKDISGLIDSLCVN